MSLKIMTPSRLTPLCARTIASVILTTILYTHCQCNELPFPRKPNGLSSLDNNGGVDGHTELTSIKPLVKGESPIWTRHSESTKLVDNLGDGERRLSLPVDGGGSSEEEEEAEGEDEEDEEEEESTTIRGESGARDNKRFSVVGGKLMENASLQIKPLLTPDQSTSPTMNHHSHHQPASDEGEPSVDDNDVDDDDNNDDDDDDDDDDDVNDDDDDDNDDDNTEDDVNNDDSTDEFEDLNLTDPHSNDVTSTQETDTTPGSNKSLTRKDFVLGYPTPNNDNTTPTPTRTDQQAANVEMSSNSSNVTAETIHETFELTKDTNTTPGYDVTTSGVGSHSGTKTVDPSRQDDVMVTPTISGVDKMAILDLDLSQTAASPVGAGLDQPLTTVDAVTTADSSDVIMQGGDDVTTASFWDGVTDDDAIYAIHERRNVSSLLDSLMTGYDKRIRPGFGGGAVVVKTDIEIRSMGPISEKDMIYSMDCYFRQVWADHRLAFNATRERVNKLTLNVKMLDRIWMPDTIFGNGGHSYRHTITTPNMFFRLSDDGTILFSQRLTIKATCPMRLEKFPMDTQQCPLHIQSFGYPDTDVHYEWRFGNTRAAKSATDMRMSQFDLEGMPACNMTRLVKGTVYSVLTVYFDLRRHTGYFLIQVYLPCCLLVILSWVSFWINREATSERISLGATTMLTLTLIVLDTRNDLPRVTYPTALDLYVATCFAFIFASIVQFAAVHFHTKRGTADEDIPLILLDTDDDEEVEEDASDPFLPSRELSLEKVDASSTMTITMCLRKIWRCLLSTRQTQRGLSKHARTALGLNSVSQIDRLARVLFPAAFSGFNIVYWMAYL